MDGFAFYNKHYISIDGQNRVVDGWSDGPHPEKDTEGAACINDKGGYQFRLFPGGEENPALWDMDGIPLYKYEGGQVLERTPEEIGADRKAMPEPLPTEMEQMRADLDYVLVMTDLM